MKKAVALITLFFLIATTFSTFAVEEADVKIQLDKTKRSIKNLQMKIHLTDYIPYSFSIAFKHYEKAKKLLSDGEEDEAFYYAVLADIEAKISLTIALTRKMRYDILVTKKQHYLSLANSDKKDRKYRNIIERTKRYYKEQLRQKEREITKLSRQLAKLKNGFNKRMLILKAGFKKSPYGLKITLSNSALFVGRSSNISSSGKQKLLDIAKAINIFKNKKILLLTHSNRFDWKNRSTKARLESLKQFLTQAGDVTDSRINGTAHGNTKKLVRWGSANDRVEIIIHRARI